MSIKLEDTEITRTITSIASSINKIGGKALLVGGCVRDSILGKDVSDYDIEVFGINGERLKSELSKEFELDLVGISFGIIKIKHLDIDIAIPRRETKLGDGHRAFFTECDPSMTISDAAARRDFTINAIYMDPITGEIIDPFNGYDDLKNKVLRHVSAHFSEDPLRVLRGMQFISRFGLNAADDTIEICKRMSQDSLPSERLFEEWKKLLLKGQKISAGLDFLRKTGWVKYYPELNQLIGCESETASLTDSQKLNLECDAWSNTCRSLDSFAKNRIGDIYEDTVVGFAVLCHCFGIPSCAALDQNAEQHYIHSYDENSIEPTVSFMTRLTNEVQLLKDVTILVQNYMQPYSLWKDKSDDTAVRRLAKNVGRIDRLVRVASSDIRSCLANGQEIEWLVRKANKLNVMHESPNPVIRGRDLIELGLKPSESFGKILNDCFEAQLDGKIINHEDGMRYLKSILKFNN